MCGIAGFVGPGRLSHDRVRACLQLMHRRGPDDASSYVHEGPTGRWTHLLHSRLSIIDLDQRANQPYRRGRRVLSYNGELYNYIEVRARLERSRHFITTSDTEVLVEALDGSVPEAEALDGCEGMWAFALYDETDGELILCRDRFGEKPLFVLHADGGVYFGSEPKFIRALLGRPLAVDVDHLHRYLVNGYKALYKVDQTFFEGLREVSAGAMLRIGADGHERTERYWTPQPVQDPSLSYDDAVALARESLVDSVRLRLRADVPLAFCLSGGVDSNALVGIARNVLGYDVHGFTIVNTDERYEELQIVEEVVRQLGIRHTAVALSTDSFLERLRTLVRYHDAPVYTITYYVHWLLMEQIAESGYRIAISGTAADEQFSGYYDHHLAYLAAVAGDPARHATAVEEWRRHVAPLVRNPHLSDPDRFVRDPTFRDHIYLNADEFASYLHAPWSERFSETRYTDELLRNRMLNELFHESVPVILHEDDRNAMYWSVENRSPFLDRRLFDATSSIPTRHLVRDGYAKAVLRDAVRGLTPDVVVDEHRKVGFNAPIHELLDVRDPKVRGELLADSPIFDHLRRDRIEDLLDRASLPNSESKFLFNFVNAKLFLEEFDS
jgi:asparagine synthase (glutamine-hydrolysing)